MTSAAAVILGKLAEPGQTLVFCDDTDLTGTPPPGVAADLRILCALVLPSEAYGPAVAQMSERLMALGQIEFHATEIVNPKGTSTWKPVDIEQRIDAFSLLRDLVTVSSAKLYYAFVSKGQFEQLKAEAQQYAPVNVGHKAGLKRVFIRTLLDRLGPSAKNTVLVLDQNNVQTEPVVEHWPEGRWLLGGGPITATSSSVPGLQLADMAAFSIRRYLEKRELLAKDKGKPFDTIALETVAAFEGRCEHLLKHSNGVSP